MFSVQTKRHENINLICGDWLFRIVQAGDLMPSRPFTSITTPQQHKPLPLQLICRVVIITNRLVVRAPPRRLCLQLKRITPVATMHPETIMLVKMSAATPSPSQILLVQHSRLGSQDRRLGIT